MAQVRVGVGCFVVRRAGDAMQFLVGRRAGQLSPGQWGLPGGHLEFGETWEACAVREVREECGIQIPSPQHVATTNDILGNGRHYVTLLMAACLDGQPRVRLMEPDKCTAWAWITWAELRARRAVFRDACAEHSPHDAELLPRQAADLGPVYTPLSTVAQMYGDEPPSWLASATTK
ncbi:hypothetical protein IWQ57_000255 [Coemansia nantahalensis]|uniref:Uncharacterized protein n=1 Tax=Coemansia nantahalensis TaxID=2789366 RepID=A0ACC1K8L6_9FUNG|nr:hypothetical protein IWQ57_000255 [Coemansia nantahalensis]